MIAATNISFFVPREIIETMPVKVREAIQRIEADGWALVHQKGSHRQFKHAIKTGLVTIPGKPGDDLAPGTLGSILKQAGLK